jgi:phosphoribosylglycinamide formyltransferase 1
LNGGAPPQPIVILISGRGGNMRALIEQSLRAGSPYKITKVFSDRPDAGGLTVAESLGVPAQALSAAGTPDRASGRPDRATGAPNRTAYDRTAYDRTAYDRDLAAAVAACSPSLVVLAGFMRILSANFVAQFEGRILNIHPSLLPKHPGLHTHRRVLEAREAQHGATVHFVTEQLDGGPPIIQARVAVEADDDETSLAARVYAMEHRIYPLAVRWFCEGRLRYDGGKAWLDGRELRAPVQFTGAEQ